MTEKLSFEEAMQQLEGIVRQLESGEAPLEEALEKFERGIQLVKFCTRRLDETEKKVTLLIENDGGGVREEAFPADSLETE